MKNRRPLLVWLLLALCAANVLLWLAVAVRHPRDMTLAAAGVGLAVVVAGMARRLR